MSFLRSQHEPDSKRKNGYSVTIPLILYEYENAPLIFPVRVRYTLSNLITNIYHRSGIMHKH